MFEVAYSIFFFALVIEVVLFLFLNLPTPKGWKAVIMRFLNTNPKVRTMMRVHLGFCLLAGIFFVDSHNQEQRFRAEKQSVKQKDSYASELKYNYLSFKILKIQRNEYITSMLIFASLALNAYIWILNYMYDKREKYENSLKENKDEKKEPVKAE